MTDTKRGRTCARHVLIASVWALMIGHVAFGQVSLTPNRAPFLTSDQLTAVALTERAAASIVSQALAEYLAVFPNTTTTVIGAQLPDDWLPTIPGRQLVRLTDDAARAHLQQCGTLLWVHSFSLETNDVANVAIAQSNRCSISGSYFRFRRSGDGWQSEGMVSGFGGTECSCARRSKRTNRHQEHIGQRRVPGQSTDPICRNRGTPVGQSFWRATNAPWPFARIRVSSDRLQIVVNVWNIWKHSFELERLGVRQIRRTRGLFSVGVVVEHVKTEYPPFILFWTFRYEILIDALRRLGYTVTETSA
jgi:hypothetical protein